MRGNFGLKWERFWLAKFRPTLTSWIWGVVGPVGWAMAVFVNPYFHKAMKLTIRQKYSKRKNGFTKTAIARLTGRSSGSIYTFFGIHIFQQNPISTYTYFNMLQLNMHIFQHATSQHKHTWTYFSLIYIEIQHTLLQKTHIFSICIISSHIFSTYILIHLTLFQHMYCSKIVTSVYNII